MKKILAIVGSLRKDSFNKQMALAAQKVLAGKAELELLDYTDVPFFNQDLEHPAPASVTRVRTLVKEADGAYSTSVGQAACASGAANTFVFTFR